MAWANSGPTSMVAMAFANWSVNGIRKRHPRRAILRLRRPAAGQGAAVGRIALVHILGPLHAAGACLSAGGRRVVAGSSAPAAATETDHGCQRVSAAPM